MRIDADDYRLTALALDELDDTELASEIAADPEAREEVEAIRETAGVVSEAYRREARIELTDAQRDAVLGSAPSAPGPSEEPADSTPSEQPATRTDGKPVIEFPRLRRPGYRAALVAASVIILVGWAFSTGVPGRAMLATYAWIVSVRESDSQKDISRHEYEEVPSLTEVLFGFEPDSQYYDSYSDRPSGPAAVAPMAPGYLGQAAPAGEAGSRTVAAEAAEAAKSEGDETGRIGPNPPPPATGGGLDGMRAVAAQEPVAGAQGIQRIVKNADMTIEVERVDVALSRITAAATELGGYVLETRSEYAEHAVAGATVKVAVPVGNFEAMLERVREAALRLLSEYASGRDATQEYVDLQSRIANLEATQARMREFLSRADTVEEALKVNAELTSIEEQISQLKGQLEYLAQRAAYSTITIVVQQKPGDATATSTPTVTPTLTPTPSPTPIDWRPQETAQEAFSTLSWLVRHLVDLAIWILLVPVPVLLPVAIIWWFVRRLRSTSSG